jgi:Rap1a immunity proteins
MKMLTVAAIVSFAALSPVQAQQLTVQETLDIKNRATTGAFGGRAEWNALGFYFQGVIEGAVGYQQTLTEQGKPPLFCPPRGKGYAVEEMIGFLNKSAPDDRSRPASLVIMESYGREYPCH